MYGNFTSNLFKLNFTHYIFKYSLEISPTISETSFELLEEISKKTKKHLHLNYNISSIITKTTLYTNLQLLNDLQIIIELENVEYSITPLQSSNQFLTDKLEQNNFLRILISEYLEELKYFQFNKAFYNPFEIFDEKTLELSRWNGFSIKIQQFFNDFALQISPKSLIFHKKNCLDLMKKIMDSQPGTNQDNLKSMFKGRKIKTRYFSKLSFYKIIDVLFPEKKTIVIESNDNNNENGDQISEEEDISFVLNPFCSSDIQIYNDQPIVLPIKYCNLMGYFLEGNIIENYRDSCSNVYRQINHFLAILTKNPKFSQLFIEWKLILSQVATNFQLFKLESNQIILSNFHKNLNLLTYSLNDFSFEQQYKTIFNDAPLLNFPSLDNWVFFLHHDDVSLGDLLLNYLHTIVQKFSYNVIKPKCVLIDSFNAEDWIPKIQENLKKSHQFSIILIPNLSNSIDFYEKLKTTITGEIGIPCQFFHAKTLETNKTNDGFYLRIMSQIAAKMGYAPWTLKDLYFSNFPTLLIGVNISLVENNIYISIIGSMNKDFSKYWSIYSIVKDKSLYIREFNQLIMQVVVKFFLVHNVYPQNLIIFRDGQLSDFSEQEKLIITESVNDYKIKEKIQANVFQMVYIEAKISQNQNILTVENINAVYQQKVSNPYIGSLMKTNEEYNKFYIYLQRNENGQEIMHPTKFKVTVLSNLVNSKEWLLHLQNFCFQLVFLNFSLSSRSFHPAPLQYAYKLGKFIQMMENNKKNSEHIAFVHENLKSLAAKGKLYFI